MKVVLSVLWSVLVLVAVGCGNDNPNEPSDALVLYFDQIARLDSEEGRLFDAIDATRTAAISGTTSEGLAVYNDLRGQILDFNQTITSIQAPSETSAAHQKWIRVWQLRLEHVDLSIQAIDQDIDADLIIQSDEKLTESNVLRAQVDQEWNDIFSG
jgi:hypothetical protein